VPGYDEVLEICPGLFSWCAVLWARGEVRGNERRPASGGSDVYANPSPVAVYDRFADYSVSPFVVKEEDIPPRS
jgi:hypothetical protein